MINYAHCTGWIVKPSDYIKDRGLPSLAHVAREVDVSERTLFNWYHNRFALFEIVVLGCVSKGEKDE